MKKSNMLKKNKDFSFCYRRGKRINLPLFSVYYVKSKYNKRVGFSVSKKIGNAVVRNRVRRRLKESFRTILPDIQENCSIIFVARSPIVDCPFANIGQGMETALKKVGVLSNEK